MMRLRPILVLVLASALALLPTTALAQTPAPEKEGFLLRIAGDASVPRGEYIAAVVVIDGDATIDGTVGSVWVIDGHLTVSGEVEEDIVVISGTVKLASSARVRNVSLAESTLERASGATVTGDVNESIEIAFSGAWAAVATAIFWGGMTLALIVAALVFAAVAGRQLTTAALSLTEDAAPVILAAVFLWLGVPVLAFALLFTIIGLILGIGVLVALLPALWFLGYIVTATRVGGWLTGLANRPLGEHPYLAAFVGVLLLQIVTWVPFVGWLVAALAGLWGAGGLALLAWRAARGGGAPSAVTPQPAMS